jgi:hypothetical protein
MKTYKWNESLPPPKWSRKRKKVHSQRLRSVVDRLCGLLSRFPSYRSRGPRFDSRSYQSF